MKKYFKIFAQVRWHQNVGMRRLVARECKEQLASQISVEMKFFFDFLLGIHSNTIYCKASRTIFGLHQTGIQQD